MNFNATEKLLSIESEADDEWHNLQLPHPARDMSLWHILTVFEDNLRFRYIGHIETDLVDIGIWADIAKYALKHSIEHIFEKCDSDYGMTAPKKTIPDVYIRAFEFYKMSMNYSGISGVFSSLHAGDSLALKVDDAYEIKYLDFIDARYAALEAVNHGQESILDVTAQIYYWFRNLDERPIALQVIEKSTTIKQKFVSYEYGPNASLLQMEMNQRPIIIPEDWSFPWGSAFNTQALINSLLVRCVYHFLAVNLTAAHSEHSGGAESSLVLVIDKADLCRDLSLFADIGEENIATFVDYMTYGFRARTPDPALQPLIPTINGKIFIPCLHIITSNLQRNILSLTARLDKTSFDTQSRSFEIGMVTSLDNHLKKFPLRCTNRKIKINGQEQEFDVLLVDTFSQSVIIFELRWILQPGDPREISNKMRECREKTVKLEKKIEFCKRHLKAVYDLAFPQETKPESYDDWNIYGAVVIEGFGGTLSENPNLPIITSDALKIGLSEINKSENLMSWIKSLDWLPCNGTHFDDGIEELKFGPHLIKRPGISMRDDARRYREHIYRSLTPYK